MVENYEVKTLQIRLQNIDEEKFGAEYNLTLDQRLDKMLTQIQLMNKSDHEKREEA